MTTLFEILKKKKIKLVSSVLFPYHQIAYDILLFRITKSSNFKYKGIS